MKASHWIRAIIDERQPLSPIPTEIQPRLANLSRIRAVIFDVYGTLIASGSGDVGSVDQTDRSNVIQDAMEIAGVSRDIAKSITWQDLRAGIQASNAERKKDGCDSPEVDIIAVWRGLLEDRGWIGGDAAISQVLRLAAAFESSANPTWPMPGSTDLIHALAKNEFELGIVSNAQVFTPFLVEDLLISKKFNDSIFKTDLCIFSNRFRSAKPGKRLFLALANALERRGILPQEAVYVGNDMLNDVWAARQIGMKTAWFAGDRRSVRDRIGDPRCAELSADLVLTSLPQLLECLTLNMSD